MKKLVVFFLFLYFNSISHAQQTNNSLQISEDSDTAFWIKYHQKMNNMFGLGSIEQNTSSYIFRLSTGCNLFEVEKSNHTSKGRIVFFIQEVDQYSDSLRIFKRQYDLNDTISKEILKLIDSSGIEQVPSDKFIEGWRHGLDGISYTFESKTGNLYTFKNYWTPESFLEIKEAQVVSHFINRLKAITKTEELYRRFNKDIPFISWRCHGSSLSISRQMTKGEYKTYQKKKRKYLRTMKKNVR